MQFYIETTAWSECAADWLAVFVPEDAEWPPALVDLSARMGGALERLREEGDLTGKLAELVPIYSPAGIQAQRLLLVGLGKTRALNPGRVLKAFSTAARAAACKPDRTLALVLPEGVEPSQAAELAACAAAVGGVGQDLYKSEPGRFPFSAVTLLAGSNDDLQAAVERGRILGESINLTRELVNRPPADVYPASFAARAQQAADEAGIACDVLDVERLQSERMQSLLAVGVGSEKTPRMVVLEYKGAGDDSPFLGLVGKGVTFDSGGVSMKTTEQMKDMKCDMAGAATVLGAVSAIARLKLPVNVRGYMGLVENLVSGTAYKLGDVLTARNGVTIEVLNTDAEGRLVLADVLVYAVDAGCNRLIDLATLTGSCMVALGEDVTGAFTNDRAWCDQVLAAGTSAGEQLWQLPMHDCFAEQLKSDVADCKNVGGRYGGASIAAKFLEKFVGSTPWVHLDIAGPSFASSNKPHREGGGTGCMLRTLVAVAESGD